MDKRPHADRGAEAGFEHLLRETLRSDASATGSECLEADTLAAWSEGALAPSERSFVEAHVARCARCQALLAAFARTLPAEPEPAAWSVRKWVLMLTPAAAAATAMALWFAVEPRRPELEPAAPQAAAATEAPASVDSPVAASPRDLAASERLRGAAAPPPPRERESAALADSRQDANRRQEADRLSAELKNENREAAARVNVPNAAPVDVNAPAPSANLNAANAKAVAEQPREVPAPVTTTVTSQSPTIQTAQSAPQRQAATPADQQQSVFGYGGGAGRGGGGARAFGRAGIAESIAVAPLVVSPANGLVQWRVVNERIVQHSADKGKTYATQYTLDDTSSITAGSSPTPLVAWLVGRAGLVLTTSDGRTWRRTAFPEPVDLTSVLAIDARTATVTTSDRRSFTTTDGGASWSAVKR